jgi:hypothetical protein
MFKNNFMHIDSHGFLGFNNIYSQKGLFQRIFELQFWTVWKRFLMFLRNGDDSGSCCCWSLLLLLVVVVVVD